MTKEERDKLGERLRQADAIARECNSARILHKALRDAAVVRVEQLTNSNANLYLDVFQLDSADVAKQMPSFALEKWMKFKKELLDDLQRYADDLQKQYDEL